MDDAKRSTVGECVFHKDTGILTTMQCAHVPNVIITPPQCDMRELQEPYIKNVPHGFNNGITKPLPNLRSESPSEHNELLVNKGTIRRLTEIECERLQGFTEIKKQFDIELWKNSIAENPKKDAQNVAEICLKKQSFVGNVEKSEEEETVLYVDANLNTNCPPINKLVPVYVHLNYVDGKVGIHSQEKSLLNVNIAEKKKSYPQYTNIEDFAQAIVLINSMLERIMLNGLEEFHLNETSSIHQKNGRYVLKLFGKEMMQRVDVADINTIMSGKLTKYITSNLSDIKNIEQILIILCYYVTNVITGFIQREIRNENLLIHLDILYGWTAFGNYDGVIKRIPKTQRYKMMGNAVMVDCVEAVAKRLELL